jgi:hypothetical protein
MIHDGCFNYHGYIKYLVIPKWLITLFTMTTGTVPSPVTLVLRHIES